uniref:Uncharacterized protein LOC105119895 n=1 Tax=Rhizophora mucronata TaxID=61149 RepID=A0A2P2IWG6_RHIMU
MGGNKSWSLIIHQRRESGKSRKLKTFLSYTLTLRCLRSGNVARMFR